MDHSDKLEGYGMITAITQKRLNEELRRCFDLNDLPTTIDERISAQSSPLSPTIDTALSGRLAAPTVEILDGSGDAHRVLFSVKIADGSIRTTHATLAIRDWTYAFSVPLVREVLSPEALASRRDIPRAIKGRIAGFPAGTRVTLVRLDFADQRVDVAQYDKRVSACPIPAELGGGSLFDAAWRSVLVAFQGCVERHFSAQEAALTSVILGTMVTFDDAASASPNLPLFTPTACAFSTSRNPDDSALSTLNLLLVTNNDPPPSAPSAGLYLPWISKAGSDACFVIGERLLIQRWILKKIIRALAWSVAEGEVKDIALRETSAGWNISYNTQRQWTDKSISYDQTRAHAISVALLTDEANKATITLHGDYSNRLSLHDKLLASASMSAEQRWSVQISLAVDESGSLRAAVERAINDPEVTVHKNEAIKILNVLMLGQLGVEMHQEAADWAASEHELAACLADQLSSGLTSHLVLQSGAPVRVTGFRLDGAGDLVIDFDTDDDGRAVAAPRVAEPPSPPQGPALRSQAATPVAATVDAPTSAANWLSTSPGLRKLRLGEITLPGTHHSNAITLSDIIAPGSQEVVALLFSGAGAFKEMGSDFAEGWRDLMKLPAESVLETTKLDPLRPVEDKPLPSLVQRVVQGWSEPQRHSVTDQLRAGARYLDMRVCAARLPAGLDFYSHHMLLGGPLSAFMEEVAAFVASTTKELVIIEAAHMNFHFCLHQRFLRLVREKLGHLLFHRPRGDTRPLAAYTVEEIVEDGPKVVLLYDDSSFNKYMAASPDEFPDVWIFRDEVDDIYDGDAYNSLAGLQDYAAKRVDGALPGGKIVKLQWLMTPGTGDFIKGVLKPREPSNLLEFSAGSDGALERFFEARLGRAINVLFVDFFVGESPAYKLAMQRNLSIAAAPRRS